MISGRCRLGRRIPSLPGLIISLAGAVVLLWGCSGTRVEPLMPTPVIFSELDMGPLDHVPEDRRWTSRRVYYATTRSRTNDLQRIDYGNAESDQVSVGMALIGFGDPGISWADLNAYSRSRERPEVVDLSIAGLAEAGRFRPDGRGRVLDVTGAAAWLMADMNAAIESARDRDLMIYVHGAKVNFYNANAFAAQLDHFLGRDMTSMAFAWPTRQNILAYGGGGDVRRAYRAAPALASLLELLARESVARRIHIVCWSAGGRVVTEALRQLHQRHEAAPDALRLGTVYFAAADVPDQEFLQALPAVNAMASRIVVTSSSSDDALKTARILMRGGTRIGERDRQLSAEQKATVLAANRLEVVDVSYDWESRGFDITGHRYWFNHPWASSDLILSIRSDLGPAERALQATEHERLWAVPPDYPARLRERLSRKDLVIRPRP